VDDDNTHEMRDRLVRLEVKLESVMMSIEKMASDRTWLGRIIIGGLVSAVLVWIAKGGLINVA
jgi:hypothetical protein